MFETIFQKQYDYFGSLIIKGEFGNKVVNNLASLIGNVGFNILKLEEVTDLSDNVITFVIADNLTEEEWVKIRSATSSTIFVIGCASPVQEPQADSCFICETSPELCIQTLISMMKMIGGDGHVMADFTDIRHVLIECGQQKHVIYIESTHSEEAIERALNQLSNKPIALDQVKGILLNMVIGEDFEFSNIYTIIHTIIARIEEEVSETTLVIFCTTFDVNKQGQELGLNMIVSY